MTINYHSCKFQTVCMKCRLEAGLDMAGSSKDYICGLCQELSSDPHQFPCGHIFCRSPCILWDESACDACCPTCLIQVPSSDVIPVNVKKKKMLDLFGAPNVQCPACYLDIIQGDVVLCHHCNKNLCYECSELHRGRMSSLSLNKLFALKKLSKRLKTLRQMQPIKEENPSAEILLGDLNNVVNSLEESCNTALSKAESQLADMEGKATASLCQTMNDIKDLQQMISSHLKKQIEIAETSDPMELMMMQQQLIYLIERATEIEFIYQSDACDLQNIKVSEIFKTIRCQMEGLHLLMSDNSLCTNIYSRSSEPSASPSGRPFCTKYEPKKIMVGSLNEDMSKEVLRDYFEQFGAIKDVFRALSEHGEGTLNWGCVTFEAEASVRAVLDQSTHTILGSEVDIKPYLAKTKNKPRLFENQSQCRFSATEGMNMQRIFVGNLGSEITNVELTNFFSKFGKLRDVDLIANKSFAFITFESEEAVSAVFLARPHSIGGQILHVRQAYTPAEISLMQRMNSSKNESLNHIFGDIDATGESELDSNSIYLVGLDESITRNMLQSYFSRFGSITNIIWNLNQEAVTGSKWAIVSFTKPASVRRALLVDRHKFGSLMITARMCRKQIRENAKETIFPDLDVDSKSVYLVGLDDSISMRMLKLYFSKFGHITNIIWNPGIQEAMTGHKWAIVTFEQEVAVQWVLSQTRHSLANCTVTARVCRQRPTEPGTSLQTSNLDVDPKSIYLVGLNSQISKSKLRNYFVKIGSIDSIVWNQNLETVTGQQWAIVTFQDEESVHKALEYSRHTIGNVTLTARVCRIQNRRNLTRKNQIGRPKSRIAIKHHRF